ncbi:MAG: helix-turn-helix domain-containing protein [Oscillospiraceae bacterium]|nr:helix-turn-helix domain-containing protein [Oscillospiraceae bacterium]
MSAVAINVKIAELRRAKRITQEDLANHLGVTNQTVSKWELGACCPDIQLLPNIADYFAVSIDALFGRSGGHESQTPHIGSVPWDDDDTIRGVVYLGKKMVKETDNLSKFTFTFEGEAKNVVCECNLNCDNIHGSANVGNNVDCDKIYGGVNVGNNLDCGNISGGVIAGNNVDCAGISGDASAGHSIHCGDIGGNASAGFEVKCNSCNCK